MDSSELAKKQNEYKKYTVPLLLVVSIPLFSQNLAESKGIINLENNVSYLDSIKDTLKDNMAFALIVYG
jgi:membrane-bound lytic murein transglycosylase D